VRQVPHPIPYQGSKRRLASTILGFLPAERKRLIEPFAGSAAVTLAAAARDAFAGYLLGDALGPLADIWGLVIGQPDRLADGYERLWRGQLADPRAAYDKARARFNATGDPVVLLYLLARCVKGSVRFNAQGEFNQSPDNRRLGMRPNVMRREIHGAHSLLSGRTESRAADFRDTLADASSDDVVYLDPPYQGISGGRDSRYLKGLPVEELLDGLHRLNRRGIPYVLSYDGRCGERTYGRELPANLRLLKVALHAGRSTQSTLSGRAEDTIESLYVSPAARSALARFGCVAQTQQQLVLQT
jgi:DNA adenine methylase